MPFRPVRVAGGLRLWLATFFTDWVREALVRSLAGSLERRERRPAEALTASVIDGANCSKSLSRAFAVVACPKPLIERADFLCRRAILLSLRNTATGPQPQAERLQLAQSLGHDLQLETAGCAQAFLDGAFSVLARGHRVQDHGSLAAGLCEVDEVGGVFQRLQIENAAL